MHSLDTCTASRLFTITNQHDQGDTVFVDTSNLSRSRFGCSQHLFVSPLEYFKVHELMSNDEEQSISEFTS